MAQFSVHAALGASRVLMNEIPAYRILERGAAVAGAVPVPIDPLTKLG
jgi:hypothetical protein